MAARYAELLGAVALTGAFALVALALGDALLSPVERLFARVLGAPSPSRAPSLERAAAALLVGFGACSYAGLALGLAHAFHWWLLAAAGAAAVALRRSRLLQYGRALRRPSRLGRFDALLVAAVALLLLVNYGAALAPPELSDELAYHLPEARHVAESGRIDLTWANTDAAPGHPLFGNIPKLAETLYAEAIAVGSYSLARALHFAVFAAFLLYAAAVLRALFSRRTALLAVLFVLLLPELTHVASSAYIDGMAVSYEVACLLAGCAWLARRSSADAARASLFAGLAMSVKYLPALTVAFVGAIGVGVALAERWRPARLARFAGAFAGVALATCGFWYAKNAVRFGNPYYPLYFGHPGVGEVAYQQLVDAIRGFKVDRTPGNFARLPTHFYVEPASVAAFFALYLAPLGLALRRIPAVLATYVLLYAAVWFFGATHQTRFLMSAVVVALLLAAIVLTEWRGRFARVATAGVAAAALLAGAPEFKDRLDRTPDALRALARTPEMQYTLRAQDRDAYLEDRFGCRSAALVWLRDHRARGNVVDNWTRFFDTPLFVYAADNGNGLVSFAPRGDVWEAARRNDLRYVYLRGSAKERALFVQKPFVKAYRALRVGPERLLLTRGTRVWRQDDCSLWRVSLR
jgi:hypothetical protein